jgi:site-specific recombinase XerD
MAIIIKCKSCGKKLESDAVPCPSCAGTEKYIIDYRPDGRHGKRVRKPLDGIVDYKVAVDLDNEIKNSISARRNPTAAVNPSHYAATFSQLKQEYLEWRWLHSEKSEVKKKTHRVLEYVWEYIVAIIGDWPIMQFDKYAVTIYQKNRQAQGLSNKTINNELYEVASFLNWCRKEKDFDLDPLTINKLEHHRPIPIILSPQEVINLVNVADPLHKALYLCLYTLGLRFAEAQYLTWGQIDFENKILRTVQKGGTWKTSVLNKWLESALQDLGVGQPGEYVFRIIKKKKDGASGPIKIVNKPIQDIRKALERDRVKAGIKKHVNPHLLRHCIATHMLARGENLRTIQSLLGHSNVGTTEWYTHVVVNDVRQATEGMFDKMFKNKGVSTPNEVK